MVLKTVLFCLLWCPSLAKYLVKSGTQQISKKYETADPDMFFHKNKAASDVINRALLFKRMEIMGMPSDIISLIKDWLDELMFHVETNEEVSSIFPSDFGTAQGLVLGPVLFGIPIRPIYVTHDE